MGRRIAIAILLTVWATLVAGGVGAYIAVRAVMLDDLDRQLVDSCRMVPDVEDIAGHTTSHEARYLITDSAGKRLGSSTVDSFIRTPAQVIGRQFVSLEGEGGRRYRSLTVRFDLPDGRHITVVYGEPTDRFDAVLARLAAGLFGAGLAAGALAAAVAMIASRAALRPLRETAGVIGAIDEANLDRRIDASRLPEELRLTAARLNEMLSRLEISFARRKQFLADASHELRTPVASLVTALEVALRRPRDAAELTRTLEACLGDARLLRRMVQALLEHARGEAKPPAAETVALSALLDECVALVEPLAMERGLVIVRSYGNTTEAAAELTADRRRLASVVTNLLSNAVEYNRPSGTIEVSTAWRSDNEVEVAVRDTGLGIHAEHLPQLFEPFFRAGKGGADDRSAADHLGLGLFLVKSHVEAMGGTVAVESAAGQGTTFRIRLPRARRVASRAADANVLEGVGGDRHPLGESSGVPLSPVLGEKAG